MALQVLLFHYPAADLMTEIINYEIRAEEQLCIIIELKGELVIRTHEMANLHAAVNEYMSAESALEPQYKRSRRLVTHAKNISK